MGDAILKKFIYNNKVYEVERFEEIYIEKNPSVYEVIRILSGVPLFLEEHYTRLLNSGRILGYDVEITYEELKGMLSRMINLNDIKNCNIKIVINSFEATTKRIYCFFVKSPYPEENLYLKGIETVVYKATRANPNAKVIYKNMREKINGLLREKNCYEAILLNEQEQITEGSRSNLFFIKDNIIYTALKEDVLIGITRIRILELCTKNNINFLEKEISLKDLDTFEAAFLSGTSPKILPINRIDEILYNCDNELLRRLMRIYNLEIENYVSNYELDSK